MSAIEEYNGLYKDYVKILKDYMDDCIGDEVIYKIFSNSVKFLDVLTEAVIFYEGENIIYANKKGLEIFGEKCFDNIKNKNIFEVVNMEQEVILLVKKTNEYLEKNKGYSTNEYKIINSSNEIFYLKVYTTYIKIKNKNFFLDLIEDITEKIVLEEKLGILLKDIKDNKEKGDIISNLSHELKTPINIILSSLQLMRDTNKKDHCEYYEKFQKYIELMCKNCYRLTRLINNTIDTTRIDRGFLELNKENYNIVQIIEDITLSILPYTNSKDIELSFDTNVEEKIMAFDIDKMERIMLNLLSNGVKFTPKGGKIRVNFIDKGEFVIISVKDTGIGIEKHLRSKIFERFNQIKSSYNKDHEGSGIGLSLVKSLVTAHEGTIEIFSEVGKGSEFIINLPAKSIESRKNTKNPLLYRRNNEDILNIEFSDVVL